MSKTIVWKNFIESIQAWKANGQENEHYFGYYTGLSAPLFNGVIQKSSQALNDLDRQIRFFLKNPVPFAWWIEPSLSDAQLLEKKGLYSPGPFTGIAALVRSSSVSKKSGIKIREVSSLEDLETWAKTLGPNFHFDEAIMNQFAHFMKEKPYYHYLASFHNKPVGAVTLFCASDSTCSIWNLAVLSEARRQGIATQLVQTCLNQASLFGCTTAVAILMASEIILPLFAKFGFQEVCHLVPYIFGYRPTAQ